MEIHVEIHWKEYRHADFLQTLKEKDLKYINLFLKKTEHVYLNEIA